VKRLSIVTAVTLAMSAVAAGFLAPGSEGSASQPIPAVHVDKNKLVNELGDPIRLLGVDRSGTEYMCLGSGILYGPSGLASITAMESWHINAVRIPLNEDCWLDINGADPRYSGANYRVAIEHYVGLLNAAGIVVILDLHWSAPGRTLATGTEFMADQSHSPTFWSSVARTFKSRPDVVFDLYNEPWHISWPCWLHGCRVAGGWETAGMHELVDDVRNAGATQPIMVGGLDRAGDVSEWLKYEPKDPLHQLVASLHLYQPGPCDTVACWTTVLKQLARHVPVVTGEMGEFDCSDSFIDQYMTWADSKGISYLAWAWDAGWNCYSGPTLIWTWSGDATGFGIGLEDHLDRLAHAPVARLSSAMS
jgi:endoglucanase